jgi:ACS family glucarate transporter-like MFS transporter
MTSSTLELNKRTISSSPEGARRLVPLLMLVASMGYICRVSVTVVAPGIMADFHLSQQQMGEVFSAFLVGYTVFQVPSGWLSDKVRARSFFLILLLGWAALTAATAVAGLSFIGSAVAGFPVLLGIRAIFGVLAAPTYPGCGRTVAANFPERLRGRANGAVLASIGIGSALTPVLLGGMSVRWGWRPALLVTAVATLAVAGIWWWLAPGPTNKRMPEPDARGIAGDETQDRSIQPLDELPQNGSNQSFQLRESESRGALANSSFWLLTASYTLQGYVGYIFVFWFYLYLVQVRHFEIMQAAWLTTLPWISTLVAIPAGGIASDMAVRRWGATWGRRSVPTVAMVLSAGLLVVGAQTGHAGVAVAALTFSTALVLSSEGPFWATVSEVSGSHSGMAGGVMNFGSNLGGMISPVLTPWLAARIGWAPALSLTAGVAAIAGLLWLGVKVRSGHRANG